MRAVVFKGIGDVVVEQRPIPQIEDPRDAIVKVKAAGVCGSDLHWYRGHQKLPVDFIPGHEFVGEVFRVGDQVSMFQTGDSVVVSSFPTPSYSKSSGSPSKLTNENNQASFSSQCGKCFYCDKGETSRCPEYYLFGESRKHSLTFNYWPKRTIDLI